MVVHLSHGTDCMMEYVAAFSATSLLYKRAHENGVWEDDGSEHRKLAEELFLWADDEDQDYSYYHESVPAAEEFYKSYDFKVLLNHRLLHQFYVNRGERENFHV